MERKKFENLLKAFYPELNVVEYTTFERYDMDENGEFIQTTPAIFVKVNGDIDYSTSINNRLGDDFGKYIGFSNIVIEKF